MWNRFHPLPVHLQTSAAFPQIAGIWHDACWRGVAGAGFLVFILRYAAHSTVEWLRLQDCTSIRQVRDFSRFITHLHVFFLQGPHLVR